MNLPLPKSRSGWFISFILVIFSYWYYYNNLYIEIYKAYQQQFFVPTIVADDQNWQIEIQVPKYTSVMAPGWIYGKIHNKSEQKQDVNLSVVFDEESTVLVPSIYKEDVFQRRITETINGYSTINFRIQFGNNVISADNCSEKLKFILNGKPLTIQSALPCPQDNGADEQLQSLKRAVIENLLLPPWANTLIPALVFIFGYLAESKTDEEKDNNLVTALYIGLFSSTAIISFYIVVSSYLWNPNNKTFLIFVWAFWFLMLFFSRNTLQDKITRIPVVNNPEPVKENKAKNASNNLQNTPQSNSTMNNSQTTASAVHEKKKCPSCGVENDFNAIECFNCRTILG